MCRFVNYFNAKYIEVHSESYYPNTQNLKTLMNLHESFMSKIWKPIIYLTSFFILHIFHDTVSAVYTVKMIHFLPLEKPHLREPVSLIIQNMFVENIRPPCLWQARRMKNCLTEALSVYTSLEIWFIGAGWAYFSLTKEISVKYC